MLTEKDVFINIRCSRLDRTKLKAMAKKRGLDSSKLVMKWYRQELNACKERAAAEGVDIKKYLKLDKVGT